MGENCVLCRCAPHFLQPPPRVQGRTDFERLQRSKAPASLVSSVPSKSSAPAVQMLRRRTDTNLRPDPPRDRPRSWSASLPTAERPRLPRKGESAEPSRVQSRAQSRASQSRSQSLTSLRSLTSAEPSRAQTPFESALGDDFDERVLDEVFGRGGSPNSRKGSPSQRRGGRKGSPGMPRSKSTFDIAAPASEVVNPLRHSASDAVGVGLMRPRKPGQRAATRCIPPLADGPMVVQVEVPPLAPHDDGADKRRRGGSASSGRAEAWRPRSGETPPGETPSGETPLEMHEMQQVRPAVHKEARREGGGPTLGGAGAASGGALVASKSRTSMVRRRVDESVTLAFEAAALVGGGIGNGPSSPIRKAPGKPESRGAADAFRKALPSQSRPKSGSKSRTSMARRSPALAPTPAPTLAPTPAYLREGAS